MNIRDIIDKILGSYQKAPRTQQEVERQRDARILARINRESPPTRLYFLEDKGIKPIEDCYSKQTKALKARLDALPSDDHYSVQ